jgi:hypothetical protein
MVPLSDPLVVVVPNPFTAQTTLHFAAELLPVKLRLYSSRNSASGFEKDCSTLTLEVGQGLPVGTYVLVIESATAAPRAVRLEKIPFELTSKA